MNASLAVRSCFFTRRSKCLIDSFSFFVLIEDRVLLALDKLFGVRTVKLVLPDKVVGHVRFSKLLILVPEVWLGRLVLVLCHFIKDAQVSHNVIRLELLAYLEQQLLLGVGKIRILSDILVRAVVLTIVVQKLIHVYVGQALCGLQFLAFSLFFLDHVIELVLLERSHESALMFPKNQLLEECRCSLVLNVLQNVNLLVHALNCRVVAFVLEHALFVSKAILSEEAATTR